ncbi:collagen alpha-2 domain protein [Mycobacterium ulcerans str. Harvey]|uniref:Collagen alpha-2 domain protein n=1 Tax=Mycobacterium ulcerans str. Harvey TaxID=1299332 RepID=A0ABP3ATS8_MYCUL|nr:collagen alpha-2 domain protein [Mycobacterium ulcerans str. Harvey]
MTPDLVTTTSDPVITVSGMVTNIGDRPVRDVMVRLEHAAAVTSSSALRTSLDGSTDQYQPAADFLTVSSELRRGQQVGFTLSAPLRSLTKPSLSIDAPGIFPVLVNVNGTPDYGAPARLDNARFLLPVVGVPPTVTPTSTLPSRPRPTSRFGSPCCGHWPIGLDWPPAFPAGPFRYG